MSFSANAPTTTETDIDSGPFWPKISPSVARKTMKLDGTVTPERLRAELVYAIRTVNMELRGFRNEQLALSKNALSEVEQEEVDGEGALVMLYKRAVLALTQAAVLEIYINYDSTNSAQRKAETQDLRIDDYRRDARFAIAEILGKRRMQSELL